MDWFYLALLAPLFWAIVNLMDDKLLQSVYKSPAFGAVISGLFGFIPGFVLFITSDGADIEPRFIFAAIAAGFTTIIWYYFYFNTLATEEPSVAIALFNVAPAIVPFLAFIFLGESLTNSQYMGLAIVLASAFLLSVVNIRKLRFSAAILTALKGSIAYAAVSILSKYAYGGGTFREIYPWIAFGFGIGGLTFLIFAQKQKEFKEIMRSSSKIIILVLVIAEVVNILAELTQGYAISKGPVSIVRGIEGIQPIYVLLIGILLSPFFPRHFREVRDKRLPKKLLLMVFMVCGLFLIHGGTK